MTYREFTGEDYTGLRKELIRKKGGAAQIEFLDVLKDSQQFIEWLEDKVSIKDGDDFDLVSGPLSEDEFKDQPEFVESELFQKWGGITPAQACRATFWGYVTLRHIQEGKIKAHFLAANGGTLPGGLERIDNVLRDSDPQSIDRIVRDALRRLSGLPEARGNRTVYVNCPFARAWWRGHIAKEIIATTTQADEKKIKKTLRINQTYWEELITSVVSKNSVFGDTKIRAALIWALSDLLDEDLQISKKAEGLFVAAELRKIVKRIGVRLAWQELSIFDAGELKQLFEQEFLATT